MTCICSKAITAKAFYSETSTAMPLLMPEYVQSYSVVPMQDTHRMVLLMSQLLPYIRILVDTASVLLLLLIDSYIFIFFPTLYS